MTSISMLIDLAYGAWAVGVWKRNTRSSARIILVAAYCRLDSEPQLMGTIRPAARAEVTMTI